MATRAESRPLTARRGTASADFDTSAWTSPSSGRFPSITTVTAVPGTSVSPRLRNSPDGSGTPSMPSSTQLEAADLVGRAEPVLDAAQQPQRRVPVALELQHDVDQVLQHPRPGHRAVLGDVADQHHRQAAFLGQRDQRGR